MSHLLCENCGMTFDSPTALTNHQQKFCLNSKYADLDSLDQQYATLQPHKMPVRSPKVPLSASIASHTSTHPKDIDRQYHELLRQIGDREDLRKKLEREKMSAQQELASLQKKENQVFVGARRQQLSDLVRRRQELAKQEDQIQKQIRNFQKQQKQQAQATKLSTDEDYVFKEGRQAGKLVMQRRLLEQKKRQIQNNLKKKRRQEQKVQQQMNSIIDQPIYIPDFRRANQQKNKPKTQPVQYEPSSPQQIRQTLIQQTALKQTKIGQTAISPQQKIKQTQIQGSVVSKVSTATNREQLLLQAGLFAGDEKTLFESLNPKGKSDQDIFIETLVAQEYDALNVLARLPKDSELYTAKLKQFQQMSKIRQDLKDKVQKVRLDKVRRQFQMEKQLTQTEKNNLQWLDNNRRQMLNRQVNILRNNYAREQQQKESPHIGTHLTHHTHRTAILQKQQSKYGRGQVIPSIDNIPPPRLESQQQGRRGYRVLLKNVKNYSGSSPMCIRMAVIEQGQDETPWTFASKYHQETAPRDERNPYNPGVRNRLDQSGAVVFNQIMEIGQDLQSRYNRSQAELYLWLLMMEKDDLKMSNQPEVTMWYCFKLTHFGSLREGTFTLSLFRDSCPYPIPPDMNRMKGRAVEQITIQLSEQALERHITNTRKTTTNRQPERMTGTAGTRKNKSAGRQHRTMKPKVSEKKIDTVHNIKSDFFIANEEMSDFEPTKSDVPTSFDFRISAIRLLPSHVGPLKIQIQWIDHQNNQLLEKEEILAELGNDMYNPQINYYKKIINRQIPGSTVVIIRIIGLSTIDYTPGVLGFTYFHLGYDEEGNILERDIPEYMMINGHFQVPIFWGTAQRYIFEQEFYSKYPTIPCTSLLLSIGEIARANPPSYESGQYNTVFFQVAQIQYRLFQQQIQRQRQRTMDYVLGYYKFKGINASEYSQDDLRKLLGQALAFNHENTSHMLKLEAMAEYSSTFGVQLAIDGAILPQNQGNNYFFATVCLYPPAKYYSQEGADLHFIKNVDLASSLTAHLLFKDEPIQFFPKYNSYVSVILQLNRIQLSSELEPASSLETVGYTVLPIFDLNKQVNCVNVGSRQVPLVQGEFGKREMKSLESNPVSYMENLEGTKKGQFSLQVRLMNGYFTRQWQAEKRSSKGKPLRSVFQNSKGFKNAQKGVLKVIEDTYGVKLS